MFEKDSKSSFSDSRQTKWWTKFSKIAYPSLKKKATDPIDKIPNLNKGKQCFALWADGVISANEFYVSDWIVHTLMLKEQELCMTEYWVRNTLNTWA